VSLLMPRTWSILASALLWLVVSVPAVAAAAPQRVAIVVGANGAAPGRKPLRYAHGDAQAVGRVLTELGGFAPADVHVLLDPDPAAVLAMLDAELAKLAKLAKANEALLFFYYSGHADGSALYPKGRPLLLTDLRSRLSDPRASVRVGLIDACRGGGWTGTKGLSETAPFEVNVPMTLDNEGSVLISSSSGLEDAHESELLEGSFFTHHWNAGLSGAADRDGDGRVTLAEGFEYAKALTIRDTALYAQSAQHPSFAMNLHGRQDLTLSTVALANASLALTQEKGPLQLVHLGTGVVVVEIPPGERHVKLAVAPGHYLLKRVAGPRTWARELTIGAGQTTRIDEAQLELVGQSAMVIKDTAPRPITLSTPPRYKIELTASGGVQHGGLSPGFSYSGDEASEYFEFFTAFAATDRWMLPGLSPTVVYRGGEQGGFEWLPWGGMPGWTFGNVGGFWFEGKPAFGVDLRWWLNGRSSIDFGVQAYSSFTYRSHAQTLFEDPETGSVQDLGHWDPPNTWINVLALGYTLTLGDSVTLHLAASFGQEVLVNGELPDFGEKSHAMSIGFGGVQTIGLRPLPLVRVHINDRWSLNFNAAVNFRLDLKRTEETYTAGFTALLGPRSKKK
jgi:hypothetical protein